MEAKEKKGVIVQSVARALTMVACFANDAELGLPSGWIFQKAQPTG